MNRRLALAAIPAALAFSTTATATPFPSYDPVSMAMGGTGVALARPSTGTLHNPAALAAMPEERRWSAGLAVGARLFDPDDLFDEIDDFQDDDLVDIVDNTIEITEGLGDRDDIADALDDLLDALADMDDGLRRVSDRPVQAEVGANLAVNRADRDLGIGVSYGAWAAVSATAEYKDGDLLDQLADEIERCIDRIDAGDDCTAADGFDLINVEFSPDTAEIVFDPDSDLESEARIRAILVRELGITFAREFAFNDHPVAIGITPKSQSIETFDYVASIDDADEDDFDDSDFRRTHSDFNVDIGAITPLGDSWTVGLTVRNAIARTYKTKLGNEIDLDPQVRAGVATDRGWARLALDADLTKNESVGFVDDSQFVGAGIELDAAGWAQLRAGYRVDLENSDRNIVSTGVGLSPFDRFRIDLGVARSSNEIGAGLQLALTF